MLVCDPLARARFYLPARAMFEKVDRLFRSEHASCLSDAEASARLPPHARRSGGLDSREKAIASCLFTLCTFARVAGAFFFQFDLIVINSAWTRFFRARSLTIPSKKSIRASRVAFEARVEELVRILGGSPRGKR